MRYINHLLCAKNSRGYGVHSPFLYAFTQDVIYEKNHFYAFSEIEKVREKLKKEDIVINITDFGAGNKTQANISEIAKYSIKRKEWAQLLFRIVNFSNSKNVLELGTSLGLSTAYLASVDSNLKCVSLEGAPEIAKIARRNLELLKINNAEIIVGNIDETLDEALAKFETLDFVFFDANHRKEPTLKYFDKCLRLVDENSIFVFDDIHWSRDMEEAWNTIKKSDRVTSTIDLFEMGIVFFNKNLLKKNFKMKL